MTAPTHYSVQPFGLPQPPQGLSLQLQAPVVARTISLAGQSQLNKSAMPFKPAQQQSQQSPLQVGSHTQIYIYIHYLFYMLTAFWIVFYVTDRSVIGAVVKLEGIL